MIFIIIICVHTKQNTPIGIYSFSVSNVYGNIFISGEGTELQRKPLEMGLLERFMEYRLSFRTSLTVYFIYKSLIFAYKTVL